MPVIVPIKPRDIVREAEKLLAKATQGEAICYVLSEALGPIQMKKLREKSRDVTPYGTQPFQYESQQLKEIYELLITTKPVKKDDDIYSYEGQYQRIVFGTFSCEGKTGKFIKNPVDEEGFFSFSKMASDYFYFFERKNTNEQEKSLFSNCRSRKPFHRGGVRKDDFNRIMSSRTKDPKFVYRFLEKLVPRKALTSYEPIIADDLPGEFKGRPEFLKRFD